MSFWRRVPTWVPIFVLGLSAYLLTLPADLRNNWDTGDRFRVTAAIVERGSLQPESPCNIPPHDKRLVLGRHGCYYTIYAAGQTLLMVPLYEISSLVSAVAGAPTDFSQAVAVRSLDPILGAILLVIFYLLALEIGYRKRTAILLTLMLGFASTVWPDVQSGQEHTQVALALLAGVFFSLKFLRSRSHPLAPRQRLDGTLSLQRGDQRWLLAAGLACGFGIVTRYDFLVEALVVFLFLVWVATESVRLPPSAALLRKLSPVTLWFALGFLPFVAFDGVWNAVRFGKPWSVGESPEGQLGFPIWQGVPNLLMSPAKGLLWYLPLVWLLPLVVPAFYRRTSRLAWLVGALFVAALIFYANVVYWHGDPGWGPRYLYVVVPLLILPLGELFEAFGRLNLPARAFAVATIGLSLALQLAAVGVDPWRFWYHLIQYREQAGQLFVWKPNAYKYYWTPDARLDPELFQFGAVKDVIANALGDHAGRIHLYGATSSGPPGNSVHAQDARLLIGSARRPLNTISSIWLNSRYEWWNPVLVPLTVVARAVIVGVLLLLAGLSAGLLHLQFWNGVGPLRSRETKPESS